MADRLRPGGPWRCWVAERETTMVGVIWMQLVEKMPNPLGEREWHGYVTNFFVDERVRGEGVGGALLTALIGAPETQGLECALFVADGPEPAIVRALRVRGGGRCDRAPAGGGAAARGARLTQQARRLLTEGTGSA